jgi:hypothetical protein
MKRPPPMMAVAAVIVVFIAVIAGAMTVNASLAAGPEQPIHFPHDLHVSALQLDCTFCHRNVTKGANASIPAEQQCMFCHSVVTGQEGTRQMAELSKLREAFANDDPIDWVRVHRLPDHVRFIHEAHIRALSATPELQGQNIRNVCAVCHGDIASTNGRDKRVVQVRPLKMGDCVSCHRGVNSMGTQFHDPATGKPLAAPTDCTTCHK